MPCVHSQSVPDYVPHRGWRYSQSFFLADVEGGGHVDEGRKAVQVVTVRMREDGVGLEENKKWGGKLNYSIVNMNGFGSDCIQLA